MSDSQIAPARRHKALSASAAPLEPRPRSIYVAVAGTATFVDEDDVSISYTLTAGSVLPFRPKAITAITGATLIGWY